MSDRSRKNLAPMNEATWVEIESTVKRTLAANMAIRRIVDFTGPLGFDCAGVNTGRSRPLESESEVARSVRSFAPLVELEATFDVARDEIDAMERGAPAPVLDDTVRASLAFAMEEDAIALHGRIAEADIRGICTVAGSTLAGPDDVEALPATVVEATTILQRAGVEGPYAMLLSTELHEAVRRCVDDAGRTIYDRCGRLLDGPIAMARPLTGALVLSQRGGDFELVTGEDVALRYVSHDDENVRLALRESMTFQVHGSEAAVWIEPATSGT